MLVKLGTYRPTDPNSKLTAYIYQHLKNHNKSLSECGMQKYSVSDTCLSIVEDTVVCLALDGLVHGRRQAWR